MSESETGDDAALQGTVTAICTRHCNRPDTLIEILHEVQDQVGFIPEDAVGQIALALNLTRAEVHGVITFYHDFFRAPPGRHVIRMCRAECCQASGCESLAAHAEKVLGAKFGTTTADGAFTLRSVYCLGNCSLGPSVLVGERLYGRVDAARLDEILGELRKDASA
jgi:formate dehydrogenase subunit gamma